MLNADLLAILRCPKCRGALTESQEPSGPAALLCPACRLRYTVEDGIPNMLIEEAKPYAA